MGHQCTRGAPSHLCLPEVIVHHSEVQAQLLHITIIALEKQQIFVDFRVQRSQVVNVHIRTGPKQLGEEEAGKGQLHQHVLIEGLQRDSEQC